MGPKWGLDRTTPLWFWSKRLWPPSMTNSGGSGCQPISHVFPNGITCQHLRGGNWPHQGFGAVATFANPVRAQSPSLGRPGPPPNTL